MSKNIGDSSESYDEAIQLLERACKKSFPDSTKSDFYEALSFSMGENIPPRTSIILLAVYASEESQWPKDQCHTDMFVGRFARECSFLSREGKRMNLPGLGLCEMEMIDKYFPPRSAADFIHMDEKRNIIRITKSRPCIELIDEAIENTSLLFESVRMVFSEGRVTSIGSYLASYIRQMVANEVNDFIIYNRLRRALLSPRKFQQ